MNLNNFLDDYQHINTITCDTLDDAIFLNSSPNTVNIIHFNIRSIKKNYDNLVAFLEMSDVDFGVIILSETNVVHNVDSFGVAGYDIFYNNSFINKCDGTIVLIKSDWLPNCEIVQVRNTKFVRAAFTVNNTVIGLTALYRLPSLNVEDFLLDLQTYLDIPTTKCPIEIFGGDLNINILDAGNTTACNYLNCLGSKGFVSYINTTTRQDRVNNSCIDHFLVCHKPDKHEIKSLVLKSGLTDHFPIILSINLNKDNLQLGNTVNTADIKRIDRDKLHQLISELNWDSVYGQDVNCCTENFIHKISNCITNSTKTIVIKHLKKKKEWITQGIITSIKQRDKLKKQADRNPFDVEALVRYRRYRNMLTHLIKKSKFNFYKNKLLNCGNNAKKTWDLIREATNEQKINTGITSLRENNKLVYDNLSIANTFLEYFSNVGTNLASKIHKNEHSFPSKRILNSMFLNPMSINELIDIINSLKTKATAGDDNITSKILKDNHVYLVKPLLYIVNLIFEKGIYPELLKRATIVPIFKSGDKLNKENYRPIAVTSSVSRLIEKCIKKRLDSFLKENNVLSGSQYGFLPGVSAQDAMLHVSEYINNNFNEKFKTIGIFVDLARAFDTVDHGILLKKLENIGMRGVVYNLFDSYLKNRMQKVKVNDCFSKLNTVKIGVPQGTVLGPVLFSIYINDLFSVLLDDSSVCVCYADDTAILVRGRFWEETFQRAELCISNVRIWMDQNVLTMNVNKTFYIPFSINNKNVFTHHDLTVHEYSCLSGASQCYCSQTISMKDGVKYLGVYIDKHLKYDAHVNYVTHKIRKTIHKFYQLREFLSFKLLKIMYQTLIESIIMYGLVVWGAACDSCLHPLKITQKFIIKILMKKNKRYPSNLLFREAGLFSVRKLYIKSVAKFMRNSIKYRQLVSHGVVTRRAVRQCTFVPRMVVTTAQRHTQFIGPKLYNMIPVNIRLTTNMRGFMFRVSEWIETNYESIVGEFNLFT